MGMVYQGFHLFSHMDVLNNITFAPVRVRKLGMAAAEEKASKCFLWWGLRTSAITATRRKESAA